MNFQMKKSIYLTVFSLTALLMICGAISSFGQSLTITPDRTFSENTNGDNINLNSNSGIIGIQSLRFRGTITSKQPVLSDDYLLRLGAGGYYAPTSFYLERVGIFFRATQNWTGSATGTKISFHTASNNNTITSERMVIDQSGYVGIGSVSPTAKLHISHLASGANAHLHLHSTGSSSSVIRASSIGAGIWENHFLTGSLAGSNLVYWSNETFGTTPLILTGEGDAFVERNSSVGGYTNLGTGAPKIKMKTLTVTTSGAAGGVAYISHGLTLAKILSVSVLVNSSVGHDYPPGYGSTTAPGFQYFYFITTTDVVVENSSTSYANIAGRPARILITYKE